MAALLPLAPQDAHKLIQMTAAALPQEIIDIGNINSPKQVVLSGSASAVDKAIELGKQSYRVKKAVKLEVSCPFHSRLMKPASGRINHIMRSHINVADTSIPWFSNLDATQVCPSAFQRNKLFLNPPH